MDHKRTRCFKVWQASLVEKNVGSSALYVKQSEKIKSDFLQLMQTCTKKQLSDRRERENDLTNLVDNDITEFDGRWLLLDKFTDTYLSS